MKKSFATCEAIASVWINGKPYLSLEIMWRVMVKDTSTQHINEIIAQFKSEGVIVTAEEAATILAFLNLAAAILISERQADENS
ncbi:hypothetical protein ACVW0P_003904 [Mucilaginibacter sp. UYNi724]